ncbi:MAG: hypothetical protein JW795_11305 [Chitinivibrionales bacterium]|nr:hypothetical protein [Chitinivibrionales bacterium]
MSTKESGSRASKSGRTRRSIDDGLKVKIVLEALKETMTISELATKY